VVALERHTKRRYGVVSEYNQFRHPFDVARHPTFEPEVKRAILASWASDAHAVESQPSLRRPADVPEPVSIDDVLAALCSLDGGAPGASVRP
jgi:hypothetical protein